MYEKQNFSDGSVLTAEQLNHMETGIAEAHDALPKKLTKPETATVGDYLRISAVNTDGSFTVEAVPAPTVPTAVSAFENDAGYQTEAQVNALLAAFPTFQIQVVAQLPDAGEDKIIYLVPFADDSGSYLEYLWVNGAWEVVGSGKDSGENVTLDTTLTESGKAADAKAVGDRLAVLEGVASGDGLTAAQINALHGMFKVCLFDDSKDVDGAISAFETAFGITGGGETPDEPDVPGVTTYSVEYELVNVSSNNSVASVTEGASYSATLTAADGFTLEGATVVITMGGADITTAAYADGVVSIASVTGNVEIMASAVQVEEVVAALPEDGLVAYFDLRNVDMDTANTVKSCGSGYGIPTATKGSGSLYAWGAWIEEADEHGIKTTRSSNIGVENTSNKVTVGDEATFVALTYGPGFSVPATFGNPGNGISIDAKYTSTSGSTVTLETNVINNSLSRPDGYHSMATRMDGTVLDFKFDAGLYGASYNGADYDDFAAWNMVPEPRVWPYHSHAKIVAVAWYDRALTDIEIAEIHAFFKALEVST